MMPKSVQMGGLLIRLTRSTKDAEGRIAIGLAVVLTVIGGCILGLFTAAAIWLCVGQFVLPASVQEPVVVSLWCIAWLGYVLWYWSAPGR